MLKQGEYDAALEIYNQVEKSSSKYLVQTIFPISLQDIISHHLIFFKSF